MFAVLKDRHGAAELSEVRRQTKSDDRRAAELMAEGNFHDALARYEAKGGIKWTRTQEEAQAALVRKWAADTKADPSKTRFVFAYTNDDVDKINHAIRDVRKERGELGEDHDFETSRGKEAFAAGDRHPDHRHRQEARTPQRPRRHDHEHRRRDHSHAA